ncbi:MAG TPA: aminotransferase class I/II-fold pyridoxal phosphate-dependent enzyme, partial [Symbiobacteriaceae bacterium]|nr:aminotransferase class I/II-fold pyridoxal phosphate-dependent enzyme [Symbiobacteriaceae bacterium]
ARLEGGEAAVSAATGMGAIFAVLFALLEPGAHVVISRDIYGATFALFEQELSRYQVRRTYVDVNDLGAVAAAIRPETKLVYAESISNPTVQVADLPALADLCRANAIRLVVDNTFASPFVMRPLEMGADVVISSGTKYLGGHSDLMAGVAAGSRELMEAVRRTLVLNGAMLDPFAAWLTVRGVKTLHLRVERQCQNAQALAEFLAAHPRVEKVYYPGLDGGHPLLPHGAGAVLSFAVKGGLEAANQVIRGLKLVEFVPSLGDVTTTVSHPVLTSHRAMSPAQREALGITENLIRVSTGVEAIDDILADFGAALDAVE